MTEPITNGVFQFPTKVALYLDALAILAYLMPHDVIMKICFLTFAADNLSSFIGRTFPLLSIMEFLKLS